MIHIERFNDNDGTWNSVAALQQTFRTEQRRFLWWNYAVWIPEEKWSDVVKRAVREAKEMTHLGTHRVIEVWNDVYYVFWQGGQWYRDAYNGIVG